MSRFPVCYNCWICKLELTVKHFPRAVIDIHCVYHSFTKQIHVLSAVSAMVSDNRCDSCFAFGYLPMFFFAHCDSFCTWLEIERWTEDRAGEWEGVWRPKRLFIFLSGNSWSRVFLGEETWLKPHVKTQNIFSTQLSQFYSVFHIFNLLWFMVIIVLDTE